MRRVGLAVLVGALCSASCATPGPSPAAEREMPRGPSAPGAQPTVAPASASPGGTQASVATGVAPPPGGGPADGAVSSAGSEGAGRVRQPVTAASVTALLEGLPPDRHPRRDGHQAGLDWLLQSLTDLGFLPRAQPFTWEGLPGVTLTNVEVRVGAGGPHAPLVVACAHWDCVADSPGADDNGSGTVALLEVARRLAGRRLDADVRLVWFDAEEQGLIGAAAWAGTLADEDLSRWGGLVNLESVGYVDRRPGSQWVPPGADLLHDLGDTADFLLVLGNQASAEVAATVGDALAATSAGACRVDVFSGLAGAGWLLPDSRRSDHAVFWDRGLSAVMLTDTAPFRNPHYHRRTDAVDTVDPAVIAAAARGVERALLVLAAGLD